MSRLFWFCIALIAYVYAGYPLLVSLLARTRPRPQLRRQPIAPSVTLLIAAYNEENAIAEKIEQSLSLDYPRDRLQILVAADGSDDRTADIVRLYAQQGVELSYIPTRQGKMAAINRAMPLARGDIVVFSDANNVYAPDALTEMVAPFADPTVGAVTGTKSVVRGDGLLGESEGLYWEYESFIKEQETRLGCCTGFSGEILAVRRALFEPAPSSVINDDFYIAMRIVKMGYRVAYAPAARSFERVSMTAREETQRRARINAGWFQSMAMGSWLLPMERPVVVWQVVSHKYLRPLVPLAMIGAFLTNLLIVLRPVAPTPGEGNTAVLHPQGELSQPDTDAQTCTRRTPARAKWSLLSRLDPPLDVVVLGLQSVFFALAWMGNRMTRTGVLGKALYIPTFLANSNLAALIGLYRFLTRRQSTLWQRAQRREGTFNPLASKGDDHS
jgi:poly-beta-1,6-N-acetyl-D-glucosamine synthase